MGGILAARKTNHTVLMLWVAKVREKRQGKKCRGSWRPVCTYLRMCRSYVRAPVAWVGCWFISVRLCPHCDDVLTRQARTKHDEQKQVHDSWLQKKKRNEVMRMRHAVFPLGNNGEGIKSFFVSSSKTLSLWPLTCFFLSVFSTNYSI